jgi:guanylate kinase
MSLPGRKSRGTLFVVSAPSGAGKTSLCRRLLEVRPDLEFAVSHATRKPRPGEVDGRDYHFVTKESFRKMAEAGEFVEWAEVHGNLYGTSRKDLEELLDRRVDVIHDIDVQGAKQLRSTFMGDAVYVFILPPSMEVLGERLRGRASDTDEVVTGRLRKAKEEMQDYSAYEYVIINNVFDEALKELEAVVIAQGLRSEKMNARWVQENFLEEEQ